MPPPPPPSKSYLLVIDTDSSDDEEAQDSYRIHHRDDVPIVSDYEDDLPDVVMEEVNRRRPHIIEDEDDSEDNDPAETSTEFDNDDDCCSSPREGSGSENNNKKLTKNQKKKRARRRNKKKAKSCTNSPRRISFSNVSVRTYPRAFSEVSVPADGGWPLGMELKPLLEGAPPEVSVEEFEASKQERLKTRWEQLLQSQKVDDKILDQLTKRPDNGMPFELETRQWDYRTKMKNPLFGLLSEEQRQDILLESCTEEEEASFPPEGRARSNSVGDHSQAPSSPGKGRPRSASFSHSNEQFNEKYNQVYVHHVRNELETLRIDRTKSGATGCNCRKLTVYIPPKNGGGKKAQHRRLKPSKLRDELKKRNLYDESKSREELEKILHDAVEQEPCCGTADCFCYRNGINCQTDACSCWHDSHVHVKGGTKGGYLSVASVKERCGNPLGTLAVDVDAIDDYRARVLESGMCQFIEAAQ